MGVADDRDRERVDDTDVEVFERIPWESLENVGGDRRWVAYLVAGALVLGAVGVSLGRQGVPVPAPVVPAAESTIPVAEIGDGSPVTSPVPVSSATSYPVTEEGSWAEADLMALAEAPVEVTGASVAEWFVTDHFTRDGDDGRSFVEWAGVVGFSWLEVDRATATVAMMRLAAEGKGEYRRLDPEAWEVVLALDEEGWVVVDGPLRAEGWSPRIEIATISEGRASVETRWVDGAGLEWPVREASDESP